MERGYEGSTASAKLHQNKITRMEKDGKRRLYFPPNILEIEEAFFPRQPLRRAHCTLGEATAGFRIMTEIDRVVRGIEHHFMHSNHFAFAKGSDFNFQIGVLLQ